ncbi:hypothetical protein V502_07218 [Pseudogymnoascus sp. VKM F-4520 (FW-2644)]|nr:hypothetical protein V502_07218 [Pseudogymnoascus sp. VKM F-4520 (FW-2644)]
MPPGKVSNLEDKDAQRGRYMRMFNRKQATGTTSILVETPESFKGAQTSLDIIGNANESAEDIVQDQISKASRSPDNKESIIINNGDNDPTFEASGTKRLNQSADDGEGADRFLHKKPNDGRVLSSLDSIPAAFVPGPSLEQSRSDEVGEGPEPNTAHSRPRKTAQDVEREMKVPPGFSDIWRYTWGSSIYSVGRPSTTKSSISLVLDEHLPNFGQDATSGQLSSMATLFQLFEKFRPDAQIKSDLRTLLLQAGDAAARVLVNTRNKSQKLPLEFTIERGLYGACRELLKFGADFGKRSSTGTSLSKLALRIQRDAAEDLPKYTAVGLCHKLLVDYSTVPNAKTTKRRARQGSIAKRDSLTSIQESFTNPRPAPSPPVSHQQFSSNSTGATTAQLKLLENWFPDPTPSYRPPVERQRKGVSQLIDHFESNEGPSSLGFEAGSHRQPNNEGNVWVSPLTRSPGALNDPATTHYSHGSLAHNPVHAPQAGKYLALANGQVVLAFPVQAQVSDLQRLNSFPQFLHPSGTANSWILGPPIDALKMETFQAKSQEEFLPPHRSQSLVTNDRNNTVYRDQGYNPQTNISVLDLNMPTSQATSQEELLPPHHFRSLVTNDGNNAVYRDQGYNPQTNISLLDHNMPTSQAAAQKDLFSSYYPALPVTNGRNDTVYRDQGYNPQAIISVLDLNMETSQAAAQEDLFSSYYPLLPVTNGRNDIIYENQGYNPEGYIFQEQQQQGPSELLAGGATPNIPANSTSSYSCYPTGQVPVRNEMGEFDFDFDLDNPDNNETTQNWN